MLTLQIVLNIEEIFFPLFKKFITLCGKEVTHSIEQVTFWFLSLFAFLFWVLSHLLTLNINQYSCENDIQRASWLLNIYKHITAHLLHSAPSPSLVINNSKNHLLLGKLNVAWHYWANFLYIYLIFEFLLCVQIMCFYYWSIILLRF